MCTLESPPIAGRNSVSPTFLQNRQLLGLFVVLCAASLHTWLLCTYPELYGGDSVIHIRNSGHIFLGHQLPMLQLLLFVTDYLGHGPAGWQSLMTILHVIAALSFYLLTTAILREPYACAAALLFVTNPFLNEISMVPFSEILMLAGLCLALSFYIRQQFFASSLVLAIACLTRYEAWILALLLALDYWVRTKENIRRFVQAVALFCWVPLLWVPLHVSLANPASPLIEMPRSALRLVRWIYLGWITAKMTPLFVLGLAMPGAWLLLQKDTLRHARRLTLTFYATFLTLILFSAHGDSHRGNHSPELFVSSREATVLVAGVVLLAGFGMQTLSRIPRLRSFMPATLGTALLFGIIQSAVLIRAQVSHPDVQLSFLLARYLDSRVHSGENVLIVAKPFSEAELSGYRTASDHLTKDVRGTIVDLSPIDFQRTAVQCRRVSSDKLRSSADRPHFAWIVIWNNAPLSLSLSVRPANLEPADTLIAAGLSVSIYRAHGNS